MEKVDKIWFNGQLVNFEEAKTHVLTHTLHYGAGAFEGVRFYNTPKGPAIFKLTEHTDRLFYSAGVIEMSVPFSRDEISQAIIDVVRASCLDSGYIRPLCYYGEGKLGINPAGVPVDVCIAVLPWGKYLDKEAVKVKTSKYIRIHPKSTVSDAKICGHYVNSILSSIEAKKAGCDEALLLDYQGNVAEGPGENIFWVKSGILFTVPLGNILNGITRDSIITIARDQGIDFEEKKINLEDLKKADEIFFTGTAAEVTGVGKIDETVIGDGEMGDVTKKLKDIYMGIVGGKNEKYDKWLSYIK